MTAQIHPLPGFHEPLSAFSHLLGAATFAVLGVILVRRARGDARRVLFLTVFAFTSVLLLSMSGVFHMLREGSTAHAVLGRLDQAAIFALIAGTHTPVQGFFFRGFARWGVLALMWLVAATGITLFSVFYHELPRGLGTGVYLLMGWIAGLAGLLVWRREGTSQVHLLIQGGVVYSVGAILLGLEWPTIVPGVIGPHELWHAAVLTALALHWKFFFQHAQQPME
ncbi:MAG: DNA-binding protein [bacterium]|nr:DNA-binding protein [bacterium]